MDNNQNQTNSDMIVCGRCGAPMNRNARYCMKCGNLNYNHEDNASMRPFIQEQVERNDIPSNISLSAGDRTGNVQLCFFFNLFALLLFVFISFFAFYSFQYHDLLSVLSSFFPVVVLLLCVSFFYIYACQFILMKANQPWWSIFVPFYHFMVLSDITFQNKYLGLLCIFPIFGQLFFLAMIYKLGKQFHHSGLLTLLFPVVMIPVIGFGNSMYGNYSIVRQDDSLEKFFQRKKTFLGILFLIIFGSIGIFLYTHWNQVLNLHSFIGKEYYVYAGQKFVDKVKKSIDSNKISCSDSSFVKGENVYYFYYYDLGDAVYLPLYSYRKPLFGYVKVDYTLGEAQYFVSISDGTYGFSETLIDNVNVDMLTQYSSIDSIPDSSISCFLK